MTGCFLPAGMTPTAPLVSMASQMFGEKATVERQELWVACGHYIEIVYEGRISPDIDVRIWIEKHRALWNYVTEKGARAVGWEL